MPRDMLLRTAALSVALALLISVTLAYPTISQQSIAYVPLSLAQSSAIGALLSLAL
jgi:hypothetical protein